jgi:hypothetical protein
MASIIMKKKFKELVVWQKSLACVVYSGLWVVMFAGCSSTPSRPPLTAELSRQDVTTAQINYQLFDFVTQFSRVVEEASDQIAARSPDAQVRRNALLWKVYAVPASYLAIEHSDPLAILVDLWALCVQQTTYFESGAGRELFGDEQTLAIQTARKLEDEIYGIATDLVNAEAMGPARKEIDQWAETHPFENLLFARPSIVAMLAKAFPDRMQGLFQTLDSVQGEIGDLKGRLALQADILPRLARWQAELLLEQTAGQLIGTQLTNAFELIAVERAGIAEEINRQRIETLDAVRQERIAALESVSEQREATLAEMREILKETLADVQLLVDAQREALVRVVDEQRVATLADLRADPMPLRFDVEPLVMSAMDRIFLRVSLLLGIGYVVLLVTALIWNRWGRKLPREAGGNG